MTEAEKVAVHDDKFAEIKDTFDGNNERDDLVFGLLMAPVCLFCVPGCCKSGSRWDLVGRVGPGGCEWVLFNVVW